MARRGMRWGTSTWLIGCDVIGAGYPGSLWFHHKPKTTTQVVVDTSCAYCLDASTACTMLPANAGATHLDVPCRPISLQSQRYALLPAAIQRWKSTKEHTSAHAHTHTHTHTPARRAAGASAWCMRKVRRTENEKGHHGSSITYALASTQTLLSLRFEGATCCQQFQRVLLHGASQYLVHLSAALHGQSQDSLWTAHHMLQRSRRHRRYAHARLYLVHLKRQPRIHLHKCHLVRLGEQRHGQLRPATVLLEVVQIYTAQALLAP